MLKSVTSTILSRSSHKDWCLRYRKAQGFIRPERHPQRELRMYHISMDTILFLESVVLFGSYSRLILSHTGRLEKEIKEVHLKFIKVVL